MPRYREVEERRDYGDGGYAGRPYGRAPYMNPVAWVIGGLIILLMILLIVFALGRTPSSNNAPVVRRPSTSSSTSGGTSGSVSGKAGTPNESGDGSTSGSAGGGGTAGTTSGSP